ncbi:MAG: acyloxyacyl hydrolase [Bacteroidales bacterium]|nr:acyloxyacyl hydrolase [Bacteroidales bacterium]
MTQTTIVRSIIFSFLFLINLTGFSQRNPAQYPPFLADSYFSINIGRINYPFSNQHLEPGFQAESVSVPHTGVRLMLYGRHFNDYLAMQISYMRPVLWVVYRNVNGAQTRHSVWMNVAGLTLKPQLPINKSLIMSGEFGLSIITRHGFRINQETIVKDANYASLLIGTGMKYHLNRSWDLTLHGVYSPPNRKVKQPHTVFISPGFQYNMRPLTADKVLANSNTGYIWPINQVTLGFTTNAAGYGVNAFFAEGAIPVFWGGDLHVERGISASYQRNVFHGRKIFSLDFGASLSYWETESAHTSFFTLAVYPVLRFTLLRTKPADLFFFYSVAGPTYISKSLVDGIDTGTRFTFHDYLGIGSFAGPSRKLSAEFKIGHYSNGNLFPQNAGVKVPLTFAVGYNF